MDEINPSKITPEERRAKKAARRAKQRETNIGRAEKMRKARLAASLIPHSGITPPVVNIGCSGWFYWRWRTLFYPTQMPTKDWFAYYQDHFETVELNAPFYSWPTINTVKTWRSQADNRNLIYTVKVIELITHVRRFEDVKDLIQDFGYIADLLEPHMGCFLFQFPASFRYSPECLDRIVSQLDHSRRNVVEFRHKSWWDEMVYAAFRKHGTIFCSCSGPGLPDDIIRTADDIYVRFHGTEKWYRHLYTEADMEAWARRIRESGSGRVWAYFNNGYDANALTNARHLREALLRQL